MVRPPDRYVSGWAGSTGKSSKRIPEIKEQIEGVKRKAKERQVKGRKSGGRGKKKTSGSREPQVSGDEIGKVIGVSGATWKRVEQAANRQANLPA